MSYIKTLSFATVTCCNCGIEFGMPEDFQSKRRQDHGPFYCPNGHRQYYLGETREERLERDLNRANARETAIRDQLDATQRSRNAYKGQVTKIKNRVGKGVCPCCNRTFPDLGKHMATKHPNWNEEE